MSPLKKFVKLALVAPFLVVGMGRPGCAASRVLSRARWLPEPIVADDACGHDDDGAALAAIKAAQDQPDLSAMTQFLAKHPDSCYASAVALDTALALKQSGYSYEALQTLRQAWTHAQSARSGVAFAYATRLGAELLHMEASIGLQDQTEEILAVFKGRPVSGQSARLLNEVREIDWTMKHTPDEARKCGGIALEEVYGTFHKNEMGTKYSHHPKTTKDGLSLTMLRNISLQMGMPMVPVRVDPRGDIPVPSVVHLKVGHYAALVAQKNKRYEFQDPSLRLDIWVDRDLLQRESSGNYMVLESSLPTSGWTPLSDADAGKIWGKGQTAGATSALPLNLQTNPAPSCPINGMPVPTMDLQGPALELTDKPALYTSPVGAPLDFRLLYEGNMPGQTTVPTNGGLGTNWSNNWDARVVLNTVNYGNIDGCSTFISTLVIYGRDGGVLSPSQAAQYGISIVPAGLYEFTPEGGFDVCPESTPYNEITASYPSGWQEVYLAQNDYFLSQLIDPQGNVTTLSYDSEDGIQRLRTVTSATGQAMQLSYDPTNVFQLVSVQEPSGAMAHFGYNAQGQLDRVTDALNLTTTFDYDAVTTDQIDSMTTPYGTTNFTTDPVNPDDADDVQSLDIVDPVGQHERAQYGHLLYDYPPAPEPLPTGMVLSSQLAEYQQYWPYRDTYYWDANTMAQVGANYADAKMYHWQHNSLAANQESGVLESTKDASQARVFFDYPGQTNPVVNTGASIFEPEDVARVLDDGSTQRDFYQYNAIGRVTQHIDPSGRELNYQYGSNNLDLLGVSDSTGEVLARFVYNGSPHRPTTVYDAGGEATQLNYNGAGQLTGIQLPTGENTTLNYDGNGFLTSLVPPAPGTMVTFTPDSAERIATSTDAVNGTLNYSYDALNHLTKVTYPDSTYEQIAYDRLDVASTRDRDGRVTHYTHDAARRLTGIQDPAGRLTALAWCNCGALSALTDGAGHTTNWTYDFLSRLTSKTYPDGSKTSYAYQNTISRLASITDALNQQTLFTYNEANQLTGVSYQNAVNPTPNVLFSYEPILGRLAAMVDGTGTSRFTYNPISNNSLGAGLLATATGPLASSAVQYGYDASNRVVSVGVNGVAENYTYNSTGQLSQVSNPLGNFGYQYDNAGRLDQVNLPNGAKTTLSYYPATQSGRLEEITHDSPAVALLAQYGYVYDPAGQITTWTSRQGTKPLKTESPAYDLAGQLTGTTETFGSLQTALGWQYDQAGNRTQSSFNGITTADTDNALNQLTQVSPTKMHVAGALNVSATVTVNGITATALAGNNFSTYVPEGMGSQVLTITAQNSGASLTQHYQVVNGQTLQYDANGNLLNDGNFQYSWSAANQLLQITELHPTNAHPAHTSQFTYDGFDRRVEDKELDGVQLGQDRKFIFDAWNIREERDQHNNVVKRFYDSGVQVVSGTNPGNYYYLKDHLGSIRNVLDVNGNVMSVIDYDMWGNESQTAGTFVPDFGYAGMFEHQPSGLVLTKFRAYSPLLGRWISRDPIDIRGGVNLYGYVANNPVNAIDPWGLWVVSIGVSISNQAGIASGVMEAGIVFDSSGGIGTFSTVGGGAGVGADFSGGFEGTFSNANSISNFGGPFTNFSGSAGAAGGEGTIGIFQGTNADGTPITGGSIVGGFGAGLGASVTETYATVTPAGFSLSSLFSKPASKGCQ